MMGRPKSVWVVGFGDVTKEGNAVLLGAGQEQIHISEFRESGTLHFLPPYLCKTSLAKFGHARFCIHDEHTSNAAEIPNGPPQIRTTDDITKISRIFS